LNNNPPHASEVERKWIAELYHFLSKNKINYNTLLSIKPEELFHEKELTQTIQGLKSLMFSEIERIELLYETYTNLTPMDLWNREINIRKNMYYKEEGLFLFFADPKGPEKERVEIALDKAETLNYTFLRNDEKAIKSLIPQVEVGMPGAKSMGRNTYPAAYLFSSIAPEAEKLYELLYSR